jgi:hypothetical protein
MPKIHAGKLKGQFPGTVVTDDKGELWVIASTAKEIVRTAKRHGILVDRKPKYIQEI